MVFPSRKIFPASSGIQLHHGDVWKNLVGPDGRGFFEPCEDNELRIATTASLDWFVSCYHSSGIFSFTVANLVTELKYHTENMLLSTMTPGLHEPTAEQLQHQLKFIVDDLLKLYDEGIVVKTPQFPEVLLVILVRVVCIALICDHPAAVKMSGCADTGHLVSPCTCCTVSQHELFSDQLLRDSFDQPNNTEHVRWAWEWVNLGSTKERDKYFKSCRTCWFEFVCLPYFDVIRMTIIDPMHKLLMGVVKNHWFSTWVQGGALRAGTAVTQ
ncbi:hypothetical protein K439DRAFT_1336500 [Ramaria rubella]|nr:hypothetical protein K439DRAFT_1336500 [Ramaria rubella]